MALLGRCHAGLCTSLRSPTAPLSGHRQLDCSQLHPSRCPGARHRWQTLPRAQASDSSDGSRSRRKADTGIGDGLDPALERAVPAEQRPVNELKQLRQASLYSWVRATAACMRDDVEHDYFLWCLLQTSSSVQHASHTDVTAVAVVCSVSGVCATPKFFRRRRLRPQRTLSGWGSPGWASSRSSAVPSPTRRSTQPLRRVQETHTLSLLPRIDAHMATLQADAWTAPRCRCPAGVLPMHQPLDMAVASASLRCLETQHQLR